MWERAYHKGRARGRPVLPRMHQLAGLPQGACGGLLHWHADNGHDAPQGFLQKLEHRMADSAHKGPFDSALIRRRIRNLSLGGENAMPDFLHRRAVEEIVFRLGVINRKFERALVCAHAPADIRARIEASGKVGEITLAAMHEIPQGCPAQLVLDVENLALKPQSLDLFISILDLALVNDLPGALVSIRRALKPDGLFMAVMPGGGSLRELRGAWALADADWNGEPALRVAPFCDLKQAGALLQMAGFALPVADSDKITLRYDGALSLMYELKALGWANPLRGRPGRPVTRGLLARAAANYEAVHADAGGRIAATFELICMAGWAPHESQQQPLKPGTACIPLAAVLGDDRQDDG